MLGVFLALLSAVAFAANLATARRGVIAGSVTQGMAISVAFGVPFFLVALALFGSFDDLRSFGWSNIGWLSAAGVVHFVLGRYATYRSSKAIGANLAGPLQDMNIIISVGMAVALLGERLTPMMMLGIVLVALGPALIWERGKTAGKAAAPSGFKPAYAEGYFFAALSALGFGSSPVLIRFGLEGGAMTPGRAVAAALISYTAATLFMMLVLMRPAALRDVLAVRRSEVFWFTVAGLSVGLAQMLRYMALALVPVAVVATMMRLTSIFRFYFSWVLNREYEAFSSSVVIGTLVSLTGALILSMDTEWWVRLAPDWPALAAFLRSRWP